MRARGALPYTAPVTRALRPPLLALALLALLALASPAPAQQRGAGAVMDRLAALFRPGRAIGFQLVFETLDTKDDVDFNTTVAEARRVDDARGRNLVVSTASYVRGGEALRFSFLIREGELLLVELQRRKDDGAWERVPPDAFSFLPGDDGASPDFLGEGEAVLVTRGLCTPGRGAAGRRRAVVVLRTFHTAAGRELDY